MKKDQQNPIPTQEIPTEFLPENVKANSPEDEQLYTRFLKSGEPLKSWREQDFAFTPSPSGDENGVDLNDDSLYYNTQGSAKDYWKEHGPLPQPSKDLRQLRKDLHQFGFCLVEDALSEEQLQVMRTRLLEQAEGERLAGVAFMYSGGAGTGMTTHATQFVMNLMNKGDCFVGLAEHDPAAVQAGPLIEQLVHETLGEEFIYNNILSIIAYPGGQPQKLHQDVPLQTEFPILLNQFVILDDVDYSNGATLMIPGSHRIMYESGNHRPVKKLPPPISLEAKAGTIVLMNGHILHGTGVNQTDKPRHIIVWTATKPWLVPGEQHLISLAPEVLEKASLKLLKRFGFVGAGGIEGHGREPGVLRGMRKEMDAGNFVRIGELSPQSSKEALTRDYTWRFTTTGRRAAMNQPEQRYPSGKLWESDDPVEQTPVDERHKVLQESTQRQWERLKNEK
jgi:ectoine hydroxylase-related dioxygenase (phytanoyl-CoA dioxygenase family)